VHWNSFRDSDLIKSNQSNGAWIGLIAKLFFPGKKLVTRCGWVRTAEMMSRHEKLQGLRRGFAKYVEWLCYRFSNAVIVTTASDKAYLVDAYGVPVEKVTVIPNTVDTRLFAPVEARAEIFSDPVRMLTVGRLAHMKNIHNLIAAVGRLDGLVNLTIVGGGDYAGELKTLAAEQACDIRFMENVNNSQLPDIYRRHDIFIMPQLYASGMSKVMIEAMACGLITIGSDLQAHREVIEDGSNGFLCGVDADSIAACTRKIIEERPGYLFGIKETARKNIVERYSMDANVDREYALYRALLAG
jgi:glycosyltransferase involved in cell wall biosynthesis